MKIYETLPHILKQMNMGVSFSTKDIAKMAGVTERIVLYRMDDIIKNVLGKRRIFQKNREWYGKPGFLNLIGLSAEEIVIMSGILAGKDRFGISLSNNVTTMMDALKKQGFLIHDEQQILERTTSTMHVNFNILRSAIDYGVQVIFEFNGSQRKIQPFRIINREYYWYLIGYEEYKYDIEAGEYSSDSKKMKTYTVANIKRLDITDEKIEYDFSKAEEILQYASNGYIDWDNPPNIIHVIVNSHLNNHINRAAFYRNWEKVAPAAHKGFTLYKVRSVHNKYHDILPTILKHMPDMIVLHPLELVETIRHTIDQYNQAIDPYLKSDIPELTTSSEVLLT